MPLSHHRDTYHSVALASMKQRGSHLFADRLNADRVSLTIYLNLKVAACISDTGAEPILPATLFHLGTPPAIELTQLNNSMWREQEGEQ